MTRSVALLFAIGLLALAPTGAEAATTFTVDTTTDNLPQVGQCSATPNDCSIRQAISASIGGDVIKIPAGTYVLTNGTVGVTKNITFIGSGARSTFINGNNNQAFLVTGIGVSAAMSDMTVTSGHLTALSFLGGGTIEHSADELTLTRMNITGTTLETTAAGGSRGAGVNVRMNANAKLTVTDSTIAGNRQIAAGGGDNQGAAVFATTVTSVSIINSTIAGNSQANLAGGMSNGSAIAMVNTPLTLRNVTISNNTGAPAINTNAVISAENTIVADNPNGNCSAPLTSLGHNLESTNSCGFSATGDKINSDPLLGPLATNGGPTDTEALAAGSPAIDAANSASCPATDQRGVARIGGCDIGAFEFVPAPSSPDATAPTLARLGVQPRAFAAARSGASIARKRKKKKTGATVNYTLDEAASVKFTIERVTKGRKKGKKCKAKRRKGKRCTIVKTVKGSFTRSSTAGANKFKFTGRIDNRKLRGGSYRLVAVATDAANNAGKTQRTSFTIKK